MKWHAKSLPWFWRSPVSSSRGDWASTVRAGLIGLAITVLVLAGKLSGELGLPALLALAVPGAVKKLRGK